MRYAGHHDGVHRGKEVSRPATATATVTRPHLDLHGGEIPADLVVRIEDGAGRHGVPAAAIARRALAAGLPGILQELDARAAWDRDRAPREDRT